MKTGAALNQEKPQQHSTSKKSKLVQEFMPEYLEILEYPPARGTRLFILAIITFCLAILLWSYLGRIDIIASAVGRLIVDDRSNVVQASLFGEVSTIGVRDGDQVLKGDVLIELDTTKAVAEQSRLASQLAILNLEIARLEALLKEDPVISFAVPNDVPAGLVQTTLRRLRADVLFYRTEDEALESAIEQNQNRQISALEIIAKSEEVLLNVEQQALRRKPLVDQDILPRLSYLELQQRTLESERALAGDKASLVELVEQQTNLTERLRQARAKRHKTVLDQLAESRTRLTDVSKQLIKANQDVHNSIVVAPANGIVQQLSVTTVGAVVEPAQSLLVIVPEGADLEAEVMILSKDIGFVSPGNLVEVKIDSFPYTKYGTVKGHIRVISQEAVEHEVMGLVYPTRITLANANVEIENQEIPLMPGMSTVAEIQTGSRRVIEYLLSPLQEYQSETLRER